jgi:pilus assembly protein Flp/PilA
MIELAFQFVRSREAATSIEYALMASGIALVIVGAVSTLGSNLSATFNAIANVFP